MGATIEQIINTYTEIKDDPDLTVYIELAKTQTGLSFYGSRYNEAVALRAAHNLVMSKPTEYSSLMGGGITVKRQGNVNVEYGDSSNSGNGDKARLSQTTYGQLLIGLMRMSYPTIGVVGAVQ